MKKPVRKHYRGGLYLQTGAKGSASWLLRYQRNGSEHWMGLGPKSVFSEKEARARARKAQQQLYDDIDPLKAKRESRRQKVLEESRKITFADAAARYYTLQEAKWSSHKHRQAFMNTLQQHVFPQIGTWPVADVDTAAVLRIVQPIWLAKNQTASRIRGRIEAILDWAIALGYRTGDNPARWETLGKVLASGGEVGRVIHHPALPYSEVPAFVAQLSQHVGIGPKALEFIILTASRTSEVLLARWPEFDMTDKKIWTVPAARMKSRKQHRVPLTGRMIKLLKALKRDSDDGLVFVGTKVGKPIGKMILPNLVKAMGCEVTIHGFRSSFRTWAAETNVVFPREVIEAALAHAVGSAVELSYQRSDVIEKRRQLMEQWSAFIAAPPRQAGSVTPIRKAGV